MAEMAVPTRRPFDPVAHELDPNFRLTKFSDLKGLGCKLPRDALNKMLEPLRDQEKSQLEAEQAHFQYVLPSPRMGLCFTLFPGQFTDTTNRREFVIIESERPTI